MKLPLHQEPPRTSTHTMAGAFDLNLDARAKRAPTSSMYIIYTYMYISIYVYIYLRGGLCRSRREACRVVPCRVMPCWMGLSFEHVVLSMTVSVFHVLGHVLLALCDSMCM